MKDVHNLVFDLDGTLIDSSEGIVQCVNYSLRTLKQAEQHPDNIKRYIGYQLREMYAEFTDAPLDELAALFREKALEVMVPSAIALPGAAVVLGQLHRSGYKMAVASTKIREHIEGIIAKFGWQDHFVTTVGGDEIPNQKPAPDAFVEAVRRMGGKPDESMAIGDTTNDVLAAKAVPMRVCAITSPFEQRSKVEAVGPDLWIEHLAELPGLLSG